MLFAVGQALTLALVVAAGPIGRLPSINNLLAIPTANITSDGKPAPRATIHPSGEHSVAITGVPQDGYDAFLGIPFAEPPIGQRRFKAPISKKWHVTSFNAVNPGPACLQGSSQLSSTFGLSEDCLLLQVLTPNGTAGTHAKLPVMVWIYGGGFTAGASSTYLSGPFINYGTATKRPFILVTMNYRLGIFGFGYGKDIADNGAGNLGLRDQLLALKWVKKNIAAFGGDPKKVTLFGESAGALSTALLMLDKNQKLFRGAIMQSGAQSTAPITNTSVGWNGPYNMTAQNAGCMAPNTTSMGKSKTTWDCLRKVDALTLLAASIKTKQSALYALPFVWAPSVDGDVVPESPWAMLQAGTFSRVPFITGNCRDEGTGFIPKTITPELSLPLVVSVLEPNPVNISLIPAVQAAYPNDPTLGSPYGTGNNTFGLNAYFKQVASLLGDVAFQSRRRYFLRQANKFNFTRTWSYEFEGTTPGTPDWQGIPHGTDVPFTFGIATQTFNYTAGNQELGVGMMNYWVNFAYYLDPNGDMSKNKAVKTTRNGVTYGNGTWVTSTTSNATTVSTTTSTLTKTVWLPHGYPANKNSIRFAPGAFSLLQDDYREKQMAVFDGPVMAKNLNFKRGAE